MRLEFKITMRVTARDRRVLLKIQQAVSRAALDPEMKDATLGLQSFKAQEKEVKEA